MFYTYLKVNVQSADGAVPIEGASVYVNTSGFEQIGDGDITSTYTVSPQNYDYRLITDSSGNTETVKIESPDSAISENEYGEKSPYSVADVYVSVDGYYPVRILKTQFFPNEVSILPITLIPISRGYTNTENGTVVYNIPPNQLLIPEQRSQESFPEQMVTAMIVGEIVIPEFISVHLGYPEQYAENVYVSFPDYVKNVASSEIYPTWNEEAIRANVYAIISLTLNRIYTEWYRSQGYDFDITSTTQYDQTFIPGRAVYENVSQIVDEIFNTYVVRQGYLSPLFTAYCDGRQTSCEGMSQWGSQELAESGLTALDILKYYYGDNIELATTDNITEVPESYPGYPLSYGSMGDAVAAIQYQLNRIADNYPLIPKIPAMYRQFGLATESAVRTFQEIFNLTPDGIVGRATWNKISYVYSSVTKLSELTGEGDFGKFPENPPSVVLSYGDVNLYVSLLQFILGYLSIFYPNISYIDVDTVFGENTQQSLIEFQTLFGLTPTGVVTEEDWIKLYEVYNTVYDLAIPQLEEQGYPGSPISRGQRGENVLIMQSYLQTISAVYPEIPQISADGSFGPATENAVKAFQRRFMLPVTGVINAITWLRIVEVYNFITRQEANE